MFVILQELDTPIEVKQDSGVLSEEKTKVSIYSVLGIFTHDLYQNWKFFFLGKGRAGRGREKQATFLVNKKLLK